MIEEYQDYQSDVTCEAFIASKYKTKRPAVLIAHAWAGQSDFERQKAKDLAELGYVGVAIDVYGKGVRGDPAADNSHLMGPLVSNRALLRARLLAALNFVKNNEYVDSSKIAIIGFCFGGLCALDLARTGTDEIKAAVSFHGLFIPPNIGPQPNIEAEVLILHGYDDPLAKPEALLGVADELTKAGADWQIQAFGNTSHAFTNPNARNKEAGMLYCERAANSSWLSMKWLLTKVFE
jgi:dienelactone hydrolase